MRNKKPLGIILTVCAVLLTWTSLQACAQSTIQSAIIENGVAKAAIYVDKKAPPSVHLAATDLQGFLKQTTGVELPISNDAASLKGFVIYLGDTNFARKQGIKVQQLPPDGFRLLANQKWMVIAGKDYDGPPQVGFNNPYRLNESYNSKLKISAFGNAGTLFGTYYFLEHYCGVRWYMPGALGTVIQKTDKIVAPAINLRRAPVFEQRHAYYSFMEKSDDDALWYRRAGFGAPAPIQVNHSFMFFLKYKDTHPEYFALIDGQRDFTNVSTANGGGNLNLSNPGLIQQAIDDAIQYFDEHPGQKLFPLAPNDGMKRISEDRESQAQIDKSRGEEGDFSNYVWGFINKVALGVAKKYPDKLIGCLAYEHYALPPSNIERLSPNVAVVMTKFRAMYPLKGENVKKDTQERIKAWSKKASTIYTWEYYCNTIFNPGWKGYPMFFSKLLQDDLRFERGLVKGEFIEAESWTPDQYGTAPEKIVINYPGLQHLLLYLNARLLWNPDLNVQQTLSEYYRLFYGPAEKPMRSFWELVESNWNEKGWHSSPLEVYDQKTLDQLLDYLKQAQTASTLGTPYRQRVDLIFNEFSPAAELAERLAKLTKLEMQIPLVAGAAQTDKAATPNAGSPLVQLLDRNYNVATPATNMQLAWDAQNLYVTMRCYEPNMAKLKTLATQRDSMVPPIWEDDAVEIFLEPVASNPTDPTKTLHLIVTAGGALYDSKSSKGSQIEDRAWNGHAKVTVTGEASRWIARIAIPWRDLNITDPQAGGQLDANFYRSRYTTGQLEQSSWSPLMDGRYNSPQYFGKLTLSPQPPSPEAALPNPISIIPASIKDFGSGPAAMGAYYDSGVPGIGLFVGHANLYVRNDRAIVRFDLRPLLEAAGKVQKVELTFAVTNSYGADARRTIDIQHFQNALGELNAEAANRPDVDDAGEVSVNPAEVSAERTQKVDVTAWIKSDLAQGHLSSTFRFRDVQAEKEGNTKGQAVGVVIGRASANLPALTVTLAP